MLRMSLSGIIPNKHGFLFPKLCSDRASLKAFESQADCGIIFTCPTTYSITKAFENEIVALWDYLGGFQGC